MQSISILGSTGSIGCSTIEVIQQNPEKYQVYALVAGQSAEKLAEQAKLLHPLVVVINQESEESSLRELLADYTEIRVRGGREAVIEVAEHPVDIVMMAIVGISALEPTLAAIKSGAKVAMANKESIVCAGHIMKKEALKSGAQLIPVDSEHNAIFQILQQPSLRGVYFDAIQQKTQYKLLLDRHASAGGDDRHDTCLEKVTLTASGGPFLHQTLAEMEHVTWQEAAKHPKWSMGPVNSINSANLMNKAMEHIEACILFYLEPEQVEVIIHPESTVHALVHYSDGSTLAQINPPSMHVPISYAIGYPERLPIKHKPLDLTELKHLTFLKPDLERFPSLTLPKKILRAQKSYAVAMNAANEVAVAAFMAGRIRFLDIYDLVDAVLQHHNGSDINSIEEVLLINNESRQKSEEIITNSYKNLE